MDCHSSGARLPGTPDPAGTALLFDFDGTLVDIAERPDAIRFGAETRNALRLLFDRFSGALAVVSGRPVDQLDGHIRIAGLPLAGIHGLEVRDGSGRHLRHDYDHGAHGALIAGASAFAGAHPGLLVETKPGSVAIHYRRQPDLADDVLAFARSLAAATAGAELIAGKMVAELRLGGRSKADAVTAIMELPAFAGRVPWFFGDDVTDEDGFAAANAIGGRSFRIGPGETVASDRFADITAFHDWLAALSRDDGQQATIGAG